MKRFVLFAALVCCSISTLLAQNNENYYVYGIDFSHAKVYAASEPESAFADAFQAINLLILTEPKKYDFNRFCGCKTSLVLDPIMKVLSTADYSNLKTYSKSFPEIDYAKCVKEYVLPQKEGTGVVLFAKFLDKPEGRAIYTVVVFDIATREIQIQQDVSGLAGGFGLRNYWAESLFVILSDYKLK